MKFTLVVLVVVFGFATFVGLSVRATDVPQAEIAPERQDHRHPALLRDAGGEKPVESREAWSRRRAAILRGMQQAAGPLPDRSSLPALDVKVTDEVKCDGYVLQAITYVADDAGRVPAHLYLPTTPARDKRRPAVVALHQTSPQGKADLGGSSASQGNMAYAPELARRGYVVLCPDYPSFGESAGYDFAADKYTSGTMKGIVNHMRAVDVLAARDDVDPTRIGAIGHSLGGHNAIFLGVFDERVKVVVSSCGWTPFHDYYGGDLKGWASDRYMPAIRDVFGLNAEKVPFDFPELIAALAPRAFLSVSPLQDENFSVEGVKKGVAGAAPIFELLGVKDNLQVRYPDGGHDFTPGMRAEAFAFVDRVLENAQPAAVPAAAKQEGAPGEEDFAAELPRIAPKEPGEALKIFRTLPGFHMELAAAEPNVASPVAISFDENGRLFICEMRDYSEQDKERLGTIRMLEDADGDGTYEKSTVFADGLSWPTALICYNGGLFVAAAPDVYWLKDTDGDGKADERKVVFTGFGRSNVQGLINSFQWGLDNRIYGSASSSGGTVRRPEQPESEAINLSGRDFSFDPRTLELRAESGGAQHGMSFDDWGRKFVSANSDHIQMVVLEDRYLGRNPFLSVPSARESIAADGPQAKVFRISPVEPWRIVRTRLRVSGVAPGLIEGGGQPAGYFTGATGVTIYRGDAFPPEYRGQAFVGDVGSNIVHRKVLEPNGVSFVAKRVDEDKEFVASPDTWFRPAQFANGPDGTLYVIDVYRETIEHPESLPPMIKKHLDLTSGRDRGRIWRVVPDGYKRPAPPKLGGAATADVVVALAHRNGWYRDTAARLLYERQDKAAVPLLEKLAMSSEAPEARVHAMYVLAGMNALSKEVVVAQLGDDNSRVREHAVILAELLAASSPDVAEKLSKMGEDADARVRFRVALAAGWLKNDIRASVLTSILRRDDNDHWTVTAALSSIGDDAGVVLTELATDAETVASEIGRQTLGELARQAGARNRPADVAAILRIIADRPELAGVLLAGLSQASSGSGTSLRDQLAGDPAALKTLDGILAGAVKTAGDDKAEPAARVAAIQLLPIGMFATSKSALERCMAAAEAQEIQFAALSAMDRFADPGVGPVLAKAWPSMTPALRTAAVNAIFARPDRVAALFDAVDAGKIPTRDLDRARLAALADGDDAALRDRAKKLLHAAPSAARQGVFESYRPSLSLKGDAAKGKATFEKTCAACHRLENVGQEIGPNLAAMKARGAEAILLNVVDPNREVNPLFVDYIVQTTNGRTTSGLLTSETAGGITLKRAAGETETVPRSDIRRMKSSGLSIMPEGLEQGIDHQAMADLIAYILSAN